MNVEENHLIARVLEGDTQSYELLVNIHKQYVYNIILGIVKSSEDAEELTMDVFIKVFDKLDTFREDSKFTTWLYTIAYRLAIGHLRKRRVATAELKPNHDHQLDSKNPMEHKDVNQVLDIAFNNLDEEGKTLMQFYYLKELSLKEIEEITGIKAETVKVKIHRLRKKMSDILRDKFSVEDLESLMTY